MPAAREVGRCRDVLMLQQLPDRAWFRPRSPRNDRDAAPASANQGSDDKSCPVNEMTTVACDSSATPVRLADPRGRQALLAQALAIATLALESHRVAWALTPVSAPLLHALEAIEREHAVLLPESQGPGELASRIEEIAVELRAHLERLQAGPTAEGDGPAGVRVVEVLNRLVYQDLAMRASPDLRDPGNLFLSTVLKRHQGYCVGLVSFYLALAEQADLPLFAVAAPAHIFVRYDDGTVRINIETTAGGASRTDDAYIQEFSIPAAAIRRGVFLRNLAREEFLGQVRNNIGVIYSERSRFHEAAREYGLALDLDRRLPAAWYNRGNDLLRASDYGTAVRYFTKSLKLYADDVWVLNNRGMAYLGLRKASKARQDFEAALKLNPGFEQARQNLEGLGPAP